jgi:hypothetical protein
MVLGDRDELTRPVREPDRERNEIRRQRQSASISRWRPSPRVTARARRASRCATTARASPPSICRG